MRYYAAILGLLSLVTSLLVTPAPVFAQTVPTFPNCSNPQGSVKVTYSEGTHGIAGSTGTYTGSDAVYTLTGDTHMQCFCADTGNGIQTNWWKVSSLSDNEIQVMKNAGWTFIPNGSLWGLDNAPYLTKNSEYACGGGIGGGEILAASTGDVLGLASTGNSLLLAGVGTLAVISLILAVATRRK